MLRIYQQPFMQSHSEWQQKGTSNLLKLQEGSSMSKREIFCYEITHAVLNTISVYGLIQCR